MCGMRRAEARRLHLVRIRSYFLVLLFSVLCSFVLLFLLIPLSGLDSHDPFQRRNNASSWLDTRQRFCNDCFHADFPLLLNQPHACSLRQGQVVDVVFFIFTRPDDQVTRSTIRATWASVTRNNTSNFRHVFVTGFTPDAARMRRLVEEGRHFRDMVISGFLDSYNNLTLKTMTSLRWITRYCAHARFFFKIDDDVWLNTRRLLERLNESEIQLQYGVGGSCHMSTRVIRDTSSKWYASYESYPDDSYPSYCSGVSYGATLTLANKLLEVSRNVPFFFLEDVYVGLCLRELRLSPVHFEELSAHRGWDLCEAFSDRVMSYHQVSPSLMTLIWNLRTCGSGALWRILKMEFVIL